MIFGLILAGLILFLFASLQLIVWLILLPWMVAKFLLNLPIRVIKYWIKFPIRIVRYIFNVFRKIIFDKENKNKFVIDQLVYEVYDINNKFKTEFDHIYDAL